MSGELLGTVSEARDALGLPDAAAVWELVAAGDLTATQPDDGGAWVISRR